MTSSRAARLLAALVAHKSHSGEEERASRFLVEEMREMGFERTYVDEAGNAIGEKGPEDAERILMLLGHIDTVPGDLPIRFEDVEGDQLLHGRGTVDAKGPLATFAIAASRLCSHKLEELGLRVVVVGAVEEESATSKGARAIRARFDGLNQPIPSACIIGEPSRFDRVTLGYKGRVLLDVRAERELTHTAGPDPGIGVQVVEFWNLLAGEAKAYNENLPKPFLQLQPSLRDLRSGLEDGILSWAEATFGVRLPLNHGTDALLGRLASAWGELAARLEGVEATETPATQLGEGGLSATWRVGDRRLQFCARGYEPAWKSERSSPLVRAFQRSIRATGERPGFVVKTGTSDMNVVGPVWRCPILAYGPGDSALDHTPHEHVSVKELDAAADVLHRAIEVWLETSA